MVPSLYSEPINRLVKIADISPISGKHSKRHPSSTNPIRASEAIFNALYSRLSEEKDRLYAEYESLKKRMREYDAVKQNIDSILSPNRVQEQDKAL